MTKSRICIGQWQRYGQGAWNSKCTGVYMKDLMETEQNFKDVFF